jgi:hypothetical protein
MVFSVLCCCAVFLQWRRFFLQSVSVLVEYAVVIISTTVYMQCSDLHQCGYKENTS